MEQQPRSATIPADADVPRFEDDAGNVYYGAEAIRRANAHFAEIEARNRAYVERLTPEQRAELERVLLERATPSAHEVERTRALWRLRRASKASGGGRAATVSTTARTGERARQRRRPPQRSSAKSADGDDDGGGEPQPVAFVRRRDRREVFEADVVDLAGRWAHVRGRWRYREGANYAELRYGPPITAAWPVSTLRELKWVGEGPS